MGGFVGIASPRPRRCRGEDETFSYVALAREPRASAPRSSATAPAASPDALTEGFGALVIAGPRAGSGRVTLKFCNLDGTAGERLFSRRDGVAYKRAARSGWGDVV